MCLSSTIPPDENIKTSHHREYVVVLEKQTKKGAEPFQLKSERKL